MRESAALIEGTIKLNLPNGLEQSILKGKVREGHPRDCDQLVHNSLIG